MPGRAEGKVVVVTGGSDGFGAAIVRRLSQEGAKVLIVDIQAEKGEALVATNPDRLAFLLGDVTKAETWAEAATLVQQRWKKVTTVINNAGRTYDPISTDRMDMALYDKVFDLNVRPIFLSAKALVPLMRGLPGASFVNIESTAHTRPRPGLAAYNASKAAVAIATKTLALENAPLIRFNCISPAIGNTGMLQSLLESYEDKGKRTQELLSLIPMGRFTEPEDIANAALFLISDEASFVTGTTLEVDGGRGV